MTNSQKYICPHDGTLFELLVHFFPDSSKTTLRSWIKDKRISVDGLAAKAPNQELVKGQTIAFGTKTRLVENNFPILYDDNAIVVIDKPEGLLSVSTAFEKTETAFAYLKRKYYPRPVYVVHRLDQETSGVMLFALSEAALKQLKKLFEVHSIQRRYVAIVEGALPDKEGVWESYLYEDANYVVKITEDAEQGEHAVTHYHVKKSNRQRSWLELTLETGKKNQIRVHCQAAGHPVVGDKKYNSSCNPVRRLCLHAHYLAFDHPITGKWMQFTSPVPTSFERAYKS